MEKNVIDVIVDRMYERDSCYICKTMGWKCPFNDNVSDDKDQDPDGSICKNFVKSHILDNIKK